MTPRAHLVIRATVVEGASGPLVAPTAAAFDEHKFGPEADQFCPRLPQNKRWVFFSYSRACSCLSASGVAPAKDAELSRRFYTDLGFTINWSDEQIAELQIGSFRFLLQTFYVAEHAGNFMVSLSVEDADAWWEHIQRKELAKKYPGIVCTPPEMQPWGIRVLYLSDPTGVLWHITDMRKS
jgi:uncharacterized glyoxalase superfamily protein PhnB